jgi:hypothetical protein
MTSRWWVVAVATGWTVAGQAAAAEPADLTVVYTGRMLGYARACREEVLLPKKPGKGFRPRVSRTRLGEPSFDVPLYKRHCAKWDEQPHYGSLLAEQIRLARDGSARSLTVGTGDYFAVEYGARTMRVARKEGQVRVPKDELYYHSGLKGWVWREDFRGKPRQFESVIEDGAGGDSKIDGDSVTSFLSASGYDVLVPGRHDFHFGAEWLRRVARLLEESGVRMLGANLVMRALPLKPAATREEENREKDYETKHEEVKIDLPKAVMPWLRQVKVTAKGDAVVEKLQLCRAEHVDELGCTCELPDAKEFEPKGDGTYQRRAEDTEAVADGTYHLCAVVRGETKRYCETVTVERLFFSHGGGAYYVSAEKDVVVFGAVTAGMEKEFGRMSAVWKHRPEEGEALREIRVEALDPLTALRQQLDQCKARKECVEGRPRILLAQMTAEAAAGIQRSLGDDRFDLVIAEPSAAQATPFERVEYPAKYPPLVLAPRRPYDPKSKGKMSVHAQRVILKGSGGAMSEGLARKELWEPPVEATSALTDVVPEVVKNLGLQPSEKADEAFREMVLGVMRREGKASMAVLQKRDLFETAERLEKVPKGLLDEHDRIRAGLERVLWKGDFLFTRMVKGSALKQVLARSKQFDTADNDIYTSSNRTNRGLWVLGAFEDKTTKSWVIDGAPVSDEKTYAMALPDYLAFGDTDYPELAVPLVGLDEPATAMEGARRISEVVYEWMEAACKGQIPAPRREQEFSSYFDYAIWKDPVSAPRARQWELLVDYFKAGRRWTPALPGVAPGKPIRDNQTLTQIRPRWRLLNEKSEFSVTWLGNNQRDQAELLRRFEGSQESRVTTAENSVWGAAWALELRREKQRSIDFLRTESKLSQQSQQNRAGRVARTYPQNEFSLEGGWRRSFTPVIHQKWWIGALVSGLWTTQLANERKETTYTFVKGAEDCPVGSTLLPTEAEQPSRCQPGFDAVIGRRSRYLAKLGLRGETRDSWWEAGLLGGAVRRPVVYRFFRKPCDLREMLLATCLAGLSVNGPQPERFVQKGEMGNAPETGLFANFNWRIPLRADKKVEVVLENRGRFYFNHGQHFPLDTRVYNVFSGGLAVPLWGRLALKPTWTLLRFVNKAGLERNREGVLVERPARGLTSQSVEMKLEYRFDWLGGQDWGKVLRYGGGK